MLIHTHSPDDLGNPAPEWHQMAHRVRFAAATDDGCQVGGAEN